MDTLMDILLTLLAQPAGALPSAPLREAVEHVFRVFCEDLTPTGARLGGRLCVCFVCFFVCVCACVRAYACTCVVAASRRYGARALLALSGARAAGHPHFIPPPSRFPPSCRHAGHATHHRPAGGGGQGG